MKIHVLSDLHNEFDEYAPSPAATSEADVVVLAGDIDVGIKGLLRADRAFDCPTIYVPGNHEFYHQHLEHTLDDMRKFNTKKVKVLDMDEVIIGDVRFLGATMWTDFECTGDPALAALFAQQRLSDFNVIRTDNDRKLRPSDLIKICANAKSWLRSKLEEKFYGKTVVITHHAPLLRSLEHSPYPDSHLDAAFTNNWEDLFEDGMADLWIHGHTHIAADYDFNKTRVISNPRGYQREETLFNPDLIVDL